MKTLILVTGGRGGSDFFQGLLDEHNEILQIPGLLRINNDFINIFNSKTNKEIAEKFIKYIPLIFDSRKNDHERHNKLGKNKNEFYIVNKKKFIFYFNNLNKPKKHKTYFSIIVNLYKAYYLARKKKIDKIKLILLHTHTVEYTKKLFQLENIKNCYIIHTMRHPIDALLSPIYNWLNYKQGKFFFPRELFFQKDLVINGLSNLVKMNKKIFVILLESLISNKKKVMLDFCKIFKIKYNSSLLNCTFFGKQWWGDKVSGRWLGKNNVLISKFKHEEKKEFVFFQNDLIFYQKLTARIINNYFTKKKNNYLLNNNFCFKVMPTKAEILVWKNTIRHKKIKHILSIPFFYFKRILLLNCFFLKKIKFPYSIGSK